MNKGVCNSILRCLWVVRNNTKQKVEIKMKKQLNLQLDTHIEMVQEVAFKSLAGITVGEISELRLMFNQDTHSYFSLIKLKYVIRLGLLNLEYKISDELEHILFSYIHYLISEIQLENLKSSHKIFIN